MLLTYILALIRKTDVAVDHIQRIPHKIFCGLDHTPETNPQQQNVIKFTLYGPNSRLNAHCIFFTLQICDINHFNSDHTPYIYVTRITLFLPVWTVKQLSARFHASEQGWATSATALTTNLGLKACVNRRRGVLCHPISRSKYKALVDSLATW